MNSNKDLSHFSGLAGTTLLGAFFFFLIIGVFGLRFAITGVLAFIVGALAICHRFPAGGTEP